MTTKNDKTPKNKRKVFDIEEKSRIISKLENGQTVASISQELRVSHSTISTIWKNREKVKSFASENSLKLKRVRASNYKNVDEALLNWVKDQSAHNIPFNGPILQEKANELARHLGVENFRCSSSWIQRFRARHNIIDGKIRAEEAGIAEKWLAHEWPTLCKNYRPDNIYSADETGLLYNITPEGKLSTTRITILVTASITGSSKEKLVVIAKSKKKPLRNTNSLPATFIHNSTVWMTAEIFGKWLSDWDALLQLQKRKILLLVNNSPAHHVIANLHCIKLVFLPPNVLQRLNQGVIQAIKAQYTKLLVLQKKLNFLDAILLVCESWDKVSGKMIADCFKPLLTLSWNDGIDVEIPKVKSEEDNEEFIEMDSMVSVCISENEEKVFAEEREQFDVPSIHEALNAVTVLQKFLIFNEGFNSENVQRVLKEVQEKIQSELLQNIEHGKTFEFVNVNCDVTH